MRKQSMLASLEAAAIVICDVCLKQENLSSTAAHGSVLNIVILFGAWR